jgi:cytochrome c biogenesis protein CcmG/thiol:disulfide interchange protein DsbE
MSSPDQTQHDTPPEFSWRMALPLIIFAGLAGMFFFGLKTGDPSKLPSALIGKKVPAFDLPPLEGLSEKGKQVAGLTSKDLAQGDVRIVNFWASWCLPCREEHPFLVKLASASKAPLTGINYKDKTTAARRFLGRFGNPFVAVGVDAKGSAGIDWGVTGMPETFIVSGDGTILHKHVGPIDGPIIEKELLPAIQKARLKK